jgi:carboxymethylenebutenolidase
MTAMNVSQSMLGLVALALAGCGGAVVEEQAPVELPPVVEPVPQQPVTADEGEPGRWVPVDVGGEPVRAFTVVPEEGRSLPGLVLVHSSWGVEPEVRSLARQLAAQSYAVIVPDFFEGLVPTTRLVHDELFASVTEERAVALLEAAARRLRADERVADQPVGLVAMQAGTHWALSFVTEAPGQVAALVVDSSRLMARQEPDRLRVPILVLFGGANRSFTPELARETEAAFADSDPPLEVVEIAGAGTDLLDPQALGFSATARERAIERIVGFLRQHLGAGAAE